MTARLRELAERWGGVTAMPDGANPFTVLRSCADQLISILDAEGDGGSVGGEVYRVEAHKAVAAIDRWLRNNMDDEEYAEYSAELDRVFSYNPHPAQSGVVRDEDVLQVCVDYYGEPAWKFMSHKFGCLQNMRAALEHFAKRIDEDMRDAERWRYLVRENNKGGRGTFRIVWFDESGDGFITTDGVSVDGKDEQAIVRIVDKAIQGERHES